MKLFISYSHKDESYMEEFIRCVERLIRERLIRSYWYDRKMSVGQSLSYEIKNNLQTSDIICLLISPNFLSSEQCQREKEMALKLRQKNKNNTIVAPIILSDHLWPNDPIWLNDRSISDILGSPKDTKPVDKFEDRKDAWSNIYEDLKKAIKTPKISWTGNSNISSFLALAVLVGAWSDNKNQYDRKVIPKLLGDKASYGKWYRKAHKILDRRDSPFFLKDNIWKVHNRAELWKQIGSYVTSCDLNAFKELAVSILKEPDPAFELSAEKRYAASIYGKMPKYSPQLRKGIAKGLAILGSMPDSCNRHCSQEKVEDICTLAVREILSDADWVQWGSLNNLLPALAEAAPDEFLNAVEKTLNLTPCPFDELFAQEGDGITGSNYLTGLLWALEVLAWDKQYLVTTCVVLGKLASHDPGGYWDNRPFNSLATILLPWFPQTEDTNKCRVAVKKLLKEYPDIAWKLIIQLLPNQRNSSFGSFKPKWRETVPDDQGKNVTNKEYWEQVSSYAELAINAARDNIDRLVILVDNFDKLPPSAFDKLVGVLSSDTITTFSKEQKQRLWEHLTKLKTKHRKYSDMEWALPNEQIMRVEKIADQLTPKEVFNRHQRLFDDHDFKLYEKRGNCDEQRKKLDNKRETAMSEIFQQNGIEGIISFAESVAFPQKVGFALGAITEKVFEQTLIPKYLDTSNDKHKALISEFIRRRHNDKGWQWCDNIDRSDWTSAQTGQFLACLPFAKEAWDRATEWLQDHESEYWSRAEVNYQTNGMLATAIEKLIKYGRPHAATQCLNTMRDDKQQISTDQCVQALLDALSSDESIDSTDEYSIVELIKFLQTESSVNSEDLFKVEWAYLFSLNNYQVVPQCLENRLAKNPEFFCEVIQLMYHSKKEDQTPEKPTKESMANVEKARRLLMLDAWKTPPGIQEDGIFNEEFFTQWLQRVKELCRKSGHLDVALISVGEVLIHTPADPDGLWIHRAVATVLDEDDHEANNMRSGFYNGIFNSRGVHQVDPTGKPEKDLAKQYRDKAEKVEDAGFHQLANTLRDIGKDYDRQAEDIIRESENIAK